VLWPDAFANHVLPLGRNLVFGSDRVDRASPDTGVAAEALRGVDVELDRVLEPGLRAFGTKSSFGPTPLNENRNRSVGWGLDWAVSNPLCGAQ
jgi:hypothetical protein